MYLHSTARLHIGKLTSGVDLMSSRVQHIILLPMSVVISSDHINHGAVGPALHLLL